MSTQHASLYPSLAGFQAEIQSNTTDKNGCTNTHIEMTGMAVNVSQDSSGTATIVTTQTTVNQGKSVEIVRTMESTYFYMTRWNIHVNVSFLLKFG